MLLESENRLLKDDISNEQKFIEILLNFYKRNIQGSHNKNTSSSLIQKNTNNGNINTVIEKKDEQRIKDLKDVKDVKDGAPVLENEIATISVKEKLRRKLLLLLAIP